MRDRDHLLPETATPSEMFLLTSHIDESALDFHMLAGDLVEFKSIARAALDSDYFLEHWNGVFTKGSMGEITPDIELFQFTELSVDAEVVLFRLFPEGATCPSYSYTAELVELVAEYEFHLLDLPENDLINPEAFYGRW